MSMNSIKSDALEPTRAELAPLTPAERLVRRLPVYGLPILTVRSPSSSRCCCRRPSRPC